jgi:hypothetical protein
MESLKNLCLCKYLKLVGDARLELAASGFGGQHSIQLS